MKEETIQDMKRNIIRLMNENERLVREFKSLLNYAEQQHCLHEETHRGGAIWEICDSCGMKWADDEGGKPANAHDMPKPLGDARRFFESLSRE